MDGKQVTLKSFIKTIRHFFPSFWGWVKSIPDPRNCQKITYPLESLIITGLLLFILRLGSRRQIKFELSSDILIQNLEKVFPYQAEKIPHGDTLNYLLSGVDPENISNLRTLMIRRLLRAKCFAPYRLLDRHYLIAIDGTGHVSFSKKHCDQCLQKKLKNGEIIYYHPVLEAKLILPFGMALSLDTEFMENTNPLASKQDSELKAGYRLLARIKSKFPQLKICLGLDSLFANQQIMEIAENYHWKYIINFKAGSIPTVAQEFNALLPLEPQNRLTFSQKDVRQDYQWVTEIDHEGHLVNVLSCHEIKEKQEPKDFVWLTNLNLTSKNCFIIANEGGRKRWKIENEGFNTQKNGGFNLEHAYSTNVFAVKNFYLLLQIAHILIQLMEYGILGKKRIKKLYGSAKNVAHRLMEELKFTLLDDLTLKWLDKRIRIYFDTS
ncbi:MAG: hypothetical protein AUK24_05905 [Syntrophaceae bacterium CG2_30_49_12]|nr:MAG: hypothetical protein AUK24_05905 [Syntrophaceae bacterium CG2_30_49_12]